MLLNFVITAALSIHSVSAVAYRKTTSKGKASIPCTQPYCQFPSSIDCPVNGGIHITQDALQNAVLNADRSGHPVDTSAADYASGLCASTAFHDIPYWATNLPNSAGVLYYALASNGTFYYCATMSGYANGWPSSCTENK
ncbi:hypothetical protein ACJQWK_04459 [Exserohilum turcicum]